MIALAGQVLLALALLGRHVRRRADRVVGPGQRGHVDVLGDAEIGQLDDAFFGQIIRLDGLRSR